MTTIIVTAIAIIAVITASKFTDYFIEKKKKNDLTKREKQSKPTLPIFITCNVKDYTEKELIDFGNYLLSEERSNKILSHPEKSEADKEAALNQVSHADFQNWNEKRKAE